MFLAAALMASLQTAAPAYTLTPIFTYDKNSTRCVAINDNSVVLCSTENAGVMDNGEDQTFLWQDGKIRYLPNPDGTVLYGPSHLIPTAMNNSEEVVGYEESGRGMLSQFLGGFAWDATNGLRTLSVDGKDFEPWCVNDRGLMAGNLITPGVNATVGTYLEKSNTFTPIVNFDSNLDKLEISAAIDNSGTLVGSTMFMKNGYRVRKDQEPEVLSTPLYFHDYYGDARSHADAAVNSINGKGWMVGEITRRQDVNGKAHFEHTGIIWSPENDYYLTGDAILNHINDSRVAVGTLYSQQGPPMSAMIWDSEHGLRPINYLLPLNSPILVDAPWINNKGEIVAYCANDKTWYLLRPVSQT